jgi:hypothetical protein
MTDSTFPDVAKIDEQLAYIGSRGRPVARAAAKRGVNKLAKAIADRTPIAPRARKVNGRWVQPGEARKSIKGRVLKDQNGVIVAKAGIEVGQRPGSGSAPEAHMVAAGTVDRFTGSKGIWTGKKTVRRIVQTGKQRFARGRVIARDFVKQATDEAEQSVWSAVIDTLKTGLIRETTKLG